MSRLPARHRTLLREALARRREELDALLGDDAPAPAGPLPTEPDAEEALRQLMVRLWPRVRNGIATPDDVDAMMRRLRQVAGPARDDLRFLDAWNNVYETVLRDAWKIPVRRPVVGPLLARYRKLLDGWLERIEENT